MKERKGKEEEEEMKAWVERKKRKEMKERMENKKGR
jgi:hypothetical protein